MLACQKPLFSLPSEATFLNCAYMSPQLKCVEAAGRHALVQKNNPMQVSASAFFSTQQSVRQLFARLVHASSADRIALIPSVSYGIATVAKNLPLRAGQNIVLAAEQFPSNYYSWEKLCRQQGATIRLISPPDVPITQRTQAWNEAILQAIDQDTALLSTGHVHWADGTLFDLTAFRQRTHEVGAWMVVDGSQSVGALPIHVESLQLDALISTGYKWQMGPYSTAYAYYGPVMDQGDPIEENWINRADSHDFQHLVDYRNDYRPLAGRYNVGQQSNFMLLPMLEAALQQLLAWKVENIQTYCQTINKAALDRMEEMGVHIVPEAQRAHHLFGLRTNALFDADRLVQLLQENSIAVSLRGDAIRVSPHLYNTAADVNQLAECLAKARKNQFV